MRRKIIPYNPKLKLLARKLRNQSTLSEVLLWRWLKGKQIKGYDFHRQKPIDNYIVDFYCPDLQLVIEIDGCSHDENKESYDIYRQKRLESLGVKFLRFSDRDVKHNTEAVIILICEWINNNPPQPLPRGELLIPTPTPPERGIIKRKATTF